MRSPETCLGNSTPAAAAKSWTAGEGSSWNREPQLLHGQMHFANMTGGAHLTQFGNIDGFGHDKEADAARDRAMLARAKISGGVTAAAVIQQGGNLGVALAGPEGKFELPSNPAHRAEQR